MNNTRQRICERGAQLVTIAALAALAIGAQAALPATGAGLLDPTFGVGGKVIFNVIPGNNSDDIGNGIVQPDGKLVVTGNVEVPGSGRGSILVARFTDSGAPDPTFAANGVLILPLDETAYADSFGPALGADGRIFITGGARSNDANRCVVVALLPNGVLDPTFAVNGVFRYASPRGSATGCTNIITQADGKLLVLGNTDGFRTNFVLRLTSSGALDASFGDQGVAALPGSTTNYVYGLSVAPSGAVYLSGGAANGAAGIVYRLTSAGILDATFANGGVYQTAATNVFLHDVQALPDGSAVTVGYHGNAHFVLKLTSAGVPAADFGSGGVREITLGSGYAAVSVDLQRDGKIVLGIRGGVDSGPWRFSVARLTANGALDPTFGNAGITQISFGTDDETLYGVALAPDGKLWAFGRADVASNDSAIALARFLADEITTPIVEFYNTILNHYFITADPNEAAAIDNGAAGPGWTRTLQTFKSGGPTKAARFYGNPDINPATGTRRGPNSHFFSLDSEEIAQVKRDIGWRFESYAFNAWPKTAGACLAGTVPVRRVYNNRFAQNDSNHRYTTSQAIYDQMIAAGWIAEGIVFCAPQ